MQKTAGSKDVVSQKDAEDLVDRKEKQSGSRGLRNIAGAGRKLSETLGKWQLKFSGHAIKSNPLEKLVITDKIEGTRAKGRQRMKY